MADLIIRVNYNLYHDDDSTEETLPKFLMIDALAKSDDMDDGQTDYASLPAWTFDFVAEIFQYLADNNGEARLSVKWDLDAEWQQAQEMKHPYGNAEFGRDNMDMPCDYCKQGNQSDIHVLGRRLANEDSKI